ncbi:chemotaxis protein CheA [Anaerocolumna cellulosilytica]|nr:two-component system chemotaxis sensor kinase CheA [Anaerocolumna cellulosilytica]
MENTNDSMLDVFLFETEQLIGQLEECILNSERAGGYSEDSVHEIFRIMHTIKGSASMMMYQNIASLAHAMEDLFYYIRDEKPVDLSYIVLTDLILEGIDYIKVEVEKIKNEDDLDGNFSELIHRIEAYLNELKDMTKLKTDCNTENTESSCEGNYYSNDAEEESRGIYQSIIFFEEGCEMENIRAFGLIHHLKPKVNEMFFLPEDIIENDKCTEVIRKDGLQLYFKTWLEEAEVYEFFYQTAFVKMVELNKIEDSIDLYKLYCQNTGKQEVSGNVNLTIEYEEAAKEEQDGKQTLRRENKERTDKESRPANVQQSIISVNVAKLDKLMDLVGEMVIAEAMVVQNSDLKGLVLDNFYKAARQLNKITDEIQDTVMSIRMVPLAATFHKMQRVVRDMCKKLGKEVTLSIQGEDTEVDKNIIEHISDPLMHLVRNALDHGIELPEERMAKGKEAAGTLTLEAKNAGSDVVVIVRDDGKGLSREKIIGKAKENGLLVKGEAEYTDKEVYGLIFLPGFSTKEKVSEFSGRGVGMDVVVKNIEVVGGSVSVDSSADKGSAITLKIPLTLAIIDGMNIKVGEACYTLPTISVKEFFRPMEKDIITDPQGNEIIMVRGQCYPILRLYEVFKVNNAHKSYEEGVIIMIEQEEKTVCIFADELLGQQQVVVKALPEYIRRIRKINGLSGCTLLGDGNISLILDIAGIVNNYF